MTVKSCAKHRLAYEDDATYEVNPPPARCPMCVWEERGGKILPDGTAVYVEKPEGGPSDG